MKFLLTGFEPFHTNKNNPTQEIVEYLREEQYQPSSEIEVEYRVLPVDFIKARKIIQSDHSFIYHLALGLAASRENAMIERFAINRRDSQIPDNAGYQPRNEPLQSDAPLALETNTDIHQIIADATSSGHVLFPSLSAGLYVCNTVYYTALQTSPNADFLHLPPVSVLDLKSEIALVKWILQWQANRLQNCAQ